MDATSWKRAGWLTAGVEQVVEVDGVVVQVVAHTNGLHVHHDHHGTNTGWVSHGVAVPGLWCEV